MSQVIQLHPLCKEPVYSKMEIETMERQVVLISQTVLAQLDKTVSAVRRSTSSYSEAATYSNRYAKRLYSSIEEIKNIKEVNSYLKG